MSDLSNTQFFRAPQETQMEVSKVLELVYEALAEKGYNPVNQIVGYIMSGDPTYITSYKNARSLIMKVERDELLEEALTYYINHKLGGKSDNQFKSKKPSANGKAQSSEGFFVYRQNEIMERLLGLDYGSKTIGVAISDRLGMTACGIDILRRDRENVLKPSIRKILEIIETEEVTKIVLGYPMHVDGTQGIRCEKTLEFKAMLEKKTKVPIVLQDERFTTVEADQIMEEQGIFDYRERKKQVDRIAAALILQSYMNEHPVA